MPDRVQARNDVLWARIGARTGVWLGLGHAGSDDSVIRPGVAPFELVVDGEPFLGTRRYSVFPAWMGATRDCSPTWSIVCPLSRRARQRCRVRPASHASRSRRRCRWTRHWAPRACGMGPMVWALSPMVRVSA